MSCENGSDIALLYQGLTLPLDVTSWIASGNSPLSGPAMLNHFNLSNIIIQDLRPVVQTLADPLLPTYPKAVTDPHQPCHLSHLIAYLKIKT